VAFLLRHNIHHSVHPHKMNYHAKIYALFQIIVKRILATNTVGSISADLEPGDSVVPNDFVDFTKLRSPSFFDGVPVTNMDVSQRVCPEIREGVRTVGEVEEVGGSGVITCTETLDLTPAEIEMFRQLDCNLVSMTVVPKSVIAR